MDRSIYFYTDSRVLGGAENAMFMLLESLDPAAWRTTLLLDDAPEVEPLERRGLELGVPVRRVPPLPLGIAGARRVPTLARLLRAERAQVFHAHMSSPVACKWALAAALLARVPAVLGTVQVGEYEPPDRSARWQLQALARGVGRYLAVSRDIATELVDRLGWPAEKVEVSYNAVDLERFAVRAPSGLRAELDAVDRPLILTAARLDPQKGHPFLLEALVQVPDAVLALAGDGPERERLERLAADLGVAERVRFLGRRDDVPELLAACDVFALPSLYEGSSLAVLEAMAAGRPIVSSAIGGTDELIEDGVCGLLVAPRDSAALAAALRRLLDDSPLRERFAAAARARVERDLTRERMAERVTGVYADLLGEPPAVPAAPDAPPDAELRGADWRFALPEAELLASWRLPRPGGIRRVRRRAVAAGFAEVRPYWAGPLPHRAPQFWLPIDSAPAVDHLLASRAPRSALGRVLRLGWGLARRLGLLAPLYVVGSRGESGDDTDQGLPQAPLLLLTEGKRSINKVVGLAFDPDGAGPSVAAKFARVAAAEPGLEREAEVLERLAAERLDLESIPHLRGVGRRAGRFGVVEAAVVGRPMLETLDPAGFASQAGRVTAVLVELAGARSGADWRERLVDRPLERFAREFGPAVGEETVGAARDLLAGLTEPPAAIEHRDCSPWNIRFRADGTPLLLDWESAEPDGLAGMDLVYFLANCAFVLDGAIESGTTRACYERLLDPSTVHGGIAARMLDDYATAVGLSAGDLRRIRLLCWLVHSHSDHQHLVLEQGTPEREALRAAPFLGLVEAELERSQER